eukprot:COSAG02_NODE_20463_length_830_cov_1.778386_1_plen_93_part_00
MQPSLTPFAGQTTFMPPHASQESVWRRTGFELFTLGSHEFLRVLVGPSRWTGEWLAEGTLMYWYTVADKGESNSSYVGIRTCVEHPALGGSM